MIAFVMLGCIPGLSKRGAYQDVLACFAAVACLLAVRLFRWS